MNICNRIFEWNMPISTLMRKYLRELRTLRSGMYRARQAYFRSIYTEHLNGGN